MCMKKTAKNFCFKYLQGLKVENECGVYFQYRPTTNEEEIIFAEQIFLRCLPTCYYTC